MPKIRLLVIDDSATVRAIVEQIVEQDRDCEVVGVAASISAARQLIVKLRPNLITLDLNLPGISGFDFLDEIMLHRHAPVIVLSSSTSTNSQISKEAITRGADACFDKNQLLIEAKRFKSLLKKTLCDYERGLIRPATSQPKIAMDLSDTWVSRGLSRLQKFGKAPV